VNSVLINKYYVGDNNSVEILILNIWTPETNFHIQFRTLFLLIAEFNCYLIMTDGLKLCDCLAVD
jgi:hypothetical protein